MEGNVFDIFITKDAGSEMKSITIASLVAGKGIEGDRYFTGKDTFSEQLKNNPSVELSLIEKEEIDKFNLTQNKTIIYEHSITV